MSTSEIDSTVPFAEPENAFQVENCHIFLDFLVNSGLFSINFFIFGCLNRLLSKIS